MFSSGINWKDFPPKEPPASSLEISQIVSGDLDREYIYCRQCSLTLLSKEESWSPHQFDKLTERGKIEVQVWLKEKNPHRISPFSPLPRRSQETLCSACKERAAGYPGALYSIFCSAACRKQNRQHLTINRFGPVRGTAPTQPLASTHHHPDSLIEAVPEASQPSVAHLDDSNETPPKDDANQSTAFPNDLDSVISNLLKS
jgi:hypothetical protein